MAGRPEGCVEDQLRLDTPGFIATLALILTTTITLAGEPIPRADLSPEDRARVETVTRPASQFVKPEAFEAMQGGAATSKQPLDANAFSQFSANITFEERESFKLGNALFQKFWVSSPSSTQASDGLGPLYNARSCHSCHLRDGRGHPPNGAGDTTSLLLRLARPPRDITETDAIADLHAINFPDPVYGRQLQDVAVPGLAAEGKVALHYTEHELTLAGGETITLRKPQYTVADLQYGLLDPATTVSPRIANPMIGLGLIEAIADEDLEALADPDDANGDGISGKLAMVRDHRTGEPEIGRFGWKAQNATLRDQSADAFAADLGLSTPERPASAGDCTAAQPQCLAMPDGVQKRLGETEAPDPVLDLVTFYTRNLAVPLRRDVGDITVLKGKTAFYGAGCPDCHHPKFVTRRDATNPAQTFQLIWPYSDFLLHDMGEGLADGQAVGLANGQEWRTPPLWGIGMTQTVSGHTFFLHDGRARNLTEAILWHGGEATKARDAFAAMAQTDRQALITFLESL